MDVDTEPRDIIDIRNLPIVTMEDAGEFVENLLQKIDPTERRGMHFNGRQFVAQEAPRKYYGGLIKSTLTTMKAFKLIDNDDVESFFYSVKWILYNTAIRNFVKTLEEAKGKTVSIVVPRDFVKTLEEAKGKTVSIVVPRDFTDLGFVPQLRIPRENYRLVDFYLPKERAKYVFLPAFGYDEEWNQIYLTNQVRKDPSYLARKREEFINAMDTLFYYPQMPNFIHNQSSSCVSLGGFFSQTNLKTLLLGLTLFNEFINSIDHLLRLRDAYAHIYTVGDNDRSIFFKKVTDKEHKAVTMDNQMTTSKIGLTTDIVSAVMKYI